MPGTCKTKQEYIDDKFTFIENPDGTVSLFDDNILPVTSHQTKPCCDLLGYTFDVVEQECRWNTTGTNELFKVILNPDGNSSTLFDVEPNEECNLEVSFDYLFLFKCDDLLAAKAKASGVIATIDYCGNTITSASDNQIKIDELEAEISTLTNQRDFYTGLTFSVNVPPYVIECIGSGIASPGVSTLSNPSLYYGGNLPSYSFPATPINNYCLTSDGLTQWEGILDDKDAAYATSILPSVSPLSSSSYKVWLDSLGSDVSTYGCDEVNSLVALNDAALASGGQPLIETTCNYNAFDRKAFSEYFKINNAARLDAQTKLDIKVKELSDLKAIITPTTSNTPNTPSDCPEYIDMFENFDTSFTVEVLGPNGLILNTVYDENLITIGTGNLYDYIDSASGKTGILISGDTRLMPTLVETDTLGLAADLCSQIRDTLITDLFDQYLTTNPFPVTQQEQIEIFKKITEWYQSPWLQYKTVIKDKNIISLLENEKINISVSINNTCANFSILVDRIKMNKVCAKVDNVTQFISEPPKFELVRTPDNQKSWLANTARDSRYSNLKYRGTEYNTNHHRLVVNTKEVDLTLSPSRAVEQDVWCYVSDNNSILEGCISSGETYSAFSCPSGYTLDTDGNSCTVLTTTGVTTSAITYTIGSGIGLTKTVHSLSRGAIFIEDITDKTWPIYWTGTTKDSWVGPYYNSDYLTDSSGSYLNHTGFGSKTFTDGSIQYASPKAFSGIKSEYGKSNLSIYNSKLNPNILWGGTNGSVSGTPYVNISNTDNAGRLLNASIWSTGLTPTDEWIGVSYCFELTQTKVYRLGFAGDDDVRIKVNGKYIFNSVTTPSHDINKYKNFSTSYSRTAQSYLVVGVSLPAGKNIIEVEGYNAVIGVSGFVLEVYDATEAELMNMRYETELDSVRVFSTTSRIGQTFDLGEKSANSCPTGYAYDNCNTGSTSCVKIERTFRKNEQLNEYCPCPTYPLIAKDYSGATIELPLTASTGNTSSVTRVVAESARHTRFPPSSSIASVALNVDPYDGVNGLDTMFYIDNLSTPYPWTLVSNGTYSVISNDNIFLSQSTLSGNGTGQRGLQYYDGLNNFFNTVNTLGQGPNYNLTQLASDIEALFLAMEGTKITVEPIAEIAYDGAALGIRLQFKITYFGDEATINGLNQIFKIIITPHTNPNTQIHAIVPNGTYVLSPDPYYSWGAISIPVPFTCNDITTLVSNYNTTTTLKDVDVIKGRSAYALGTETTTTFNGFWITEENDGTIGLYDVNYSAGTNSCSCPAGYTPTAGNNGCQSITSSSATFNGAGSAVSSGGTFYAYGGIGTSIYPDASTLPNLPLTRTATNSALEDQLGTIIQPIQTITSNTFWQSIDATTGRLNNVGVSASTTEYLGFSHCIDVPVAKTYYIGIGASRQFRITIDGQIIIDNDYNSTINFREWQIISYYLTPGKHIIEMEGKTDFRNTFGAEIYNPTDLATLTGATNTTDAGVIFSTANKVGSTFDLGTTLGYSCPAGSALNTCNAGTPVCSVISSTGITCTAVPASSSYRNVSSQVGLDCCKVIDDAFTAYTETFKQGVDTYPSISWDNNKNKCVYRKCGDSGCIDLDEVLTTELSAIDTVKEFASTLSSELIDVKNRKTLSGYPTLKMLYDRYNTRSEEFGGIASSKYDYFDMDKFGHTVGDYWIDLIEQVIPATTIWGSTYTYKNTVFDQQKFNYRNSNTYFCKDPIGQSVYVNSEIWNAWPVASYGPNAIAQIGFQRDRYLDSTPDENTIFYYVGPPVFSVGTPGGVPDNVYALVPNDNVFLSQSTLTGNGNGNRTFSYYTMAPNGSPQSLFGTQVTLSQSPNYSLTQLANEIEDDFANRNNGFKIIVEPIAEIIRDVHGTGIRLQFQITYLGDVATVNGLNTISNIEIKPHTPLGYLNSAFRIYFPVNPVLGPSLLGPSNNPKAHIWKTISNNSPFTLLASNTSTSVIIKEIPKPIAPNPDGTVNLPTTQPSVKKCNGVYLLDRNCDSQFLGTVKQMDNLGNITLI